MAKDSSSKRPRSSSSSKKSKKPASKSRKKSAASSSSMEPDFATLSAGNPNFYFPPSEYDATFFSNEFAFESYEYQLKSARMIKPHVFDFKNFIPCDLPKLVIAQGWSKVVSMSRLYSPVLVRTFYANLAFPKNVKNPANCVLTSYVYGKSIRVDVDMMCRLLGVPNDGICAFASRGPVANLACNGHAQWRLVAPRAPVLKPIPITQLDPLCFLLYHLVSRVILPRVSDLSMIPGMEVWVLACLLRREKLNLGFMVLNHMAKERIKNSKSTIHLPYPHIVMDILEAHGINVPWCDEFTNDCVLFDLHHITSRLWLWLDGNGKLAYNNRKSMGKQFEIARELPDDDEDEESPAGPSATTPMAEDAADDDDDEEEAATEVEEDEGDEQDADFVDVHSLREEMREQFGNLSSDVADLQTSMHHLSIRFTRMDERGARIEAKLQEIFDRFPPPPPAP